MNHPILLRSPAGWTATMWKLASGCILRDTSCARWFLYGRISREGAVGLANMTAHRLGVVP
jgi:hypothetical protein